MRDSFTTYSSPTDLGFSRWVSCYEPRPHASLRLYCFAYAGGSSAVFRDWARDEGLADVEVCPVERPGRGSRLKEAPFHSLQPLVELLAASLPCEKPFAFFGHSVGAFVAFELARQLRRTSRPIPQHLFVSACRAPSVPETDPPRHTMPEDELLRDLVKLGGTSPELLEDLDLMRTFLPAIRADFALSETYVYKSEDPLQCPITAFGGDADKEVKHEEIALWRNQTSKQFSQRSFHGGHFYLETNRRELTGIIAKILAMHAIYSGMDGGN